MTSGQKIAFSLLIAIGTFVVFVLGFQSKLFKELETKFYTQSKIEENTRLLNKLSESCDVYISEILNQIENGENAWVKSPAVRSYYVQNPSENLVNERRQLTETLFSKIPALDGIRILDKNGRNVHYSSFDDTDVLKQTGITKVYKNYPDVQKDADEIEFDTLEKVFAQDKSQLLFDESRNRLIISMPYYWMDDVYSGQCLFYFNMISIQKALTRRDVLAIGENLTLFSDDNFKGGFVLNLPAGEKKTFREPVLKYWKKITKNNKNAQTPEKLLEMEDGSFWLVLSSANDSGIRVSGLYTSDTFELSKEIILLIYVSIFITILLLVFLIFSFKRDPLLVLKKRIKKIQYGIIKECIDSEDKLEWGQVAKKLKSRRNDFTLEILKSLKVNSKKKKKELEDFLNQNWTEIFSIFDDKAAAQTTKESSTSTELTEASLEEIRRVLEEVLQNTKVNVASVESIALPVKTKESDVVDDVEDIEEIEEVEEVVDDAEEIEDAEEVVDDVEEIEDAEEVLEDAEEIDDVEEIEDVEEVVDDVEEIEEVEEVIEDAEEIDDVEEIEEAEEVIEDAEEIDDVKSDMDAISLLLNQPACVYHPNDENYFCSEKFATVDNIFAEEMVIGAEISKITAISNTEEIIKVYSLPELTEQPKQDLPKVEEPEVDQASLELDEVEELTEEVPESNIHSYYSMITFGDNLAVDTPELEAVTPAENAILEENGVFYIADNLDYKSVKQDKDFKALVDSVL
ncbi:MAG: hypothetical protein MR852_10500 [Treponema sp.]|nr:hypothetical protein [Treponema sp.]